MSVHDDRRLSEEVTHNAQPTEGTGNTKPESSLNQIQKGWQVRTSDGEELGSVYGVSHSPGAGESYVTA